MNQLPLEKQSLSDSEKLDWLRLIRTDNIGPITFYNLIEFYGSAGKALDNLETLSRKGGRKKPLKAPSPDVIEKELAGLQKRGGDILTVQCADYPLALAATDDAPPVISVIGRTGMLNQSCVGMVGARNASINGRKMATKLAGDLGGRDHIIVSGLARGIDTAAHQGALKTGTIAVVAGGIDVVYPEENQKLYETICEAGCVVADSPLGQKPFAQSFPRRNRIVSGISQAVIVVEATMRSGSLITARLAGEQGRDVMAVPGSPLDPRAAGPNKLIRDGATLIRSSDDVIEVLNDFSGNSLREVTPPEDMPNFAFEDPDILPDNAAEILADALSFSPLTVDELVQSCDMSVGQVQTALLELELAGRVKRHPGNRVSLTGENNA